MPESKIIPPWTTKPQRGVGLPGLCSMTYHAISPDDGPCPLRWMPERKGLLIPSYPLGSPSPTGKRNTCMGEGQLHILDTQKQGQGGREGRQAGIAKMSYKACRKNQGEVSRKEPCFRFTPQRRLTHVLTNFPPLSEAFKVEEGRD